jgi:hypothetical protein
MGNQVRQLPRVRRRVSPKMNVIAEARERGFELEERVLGDAWVHGWTRGDDDPWPCFHSERQALSWMDDRLRRIGVFEAL